MKLNLKSIIDILNTAMEIYGDNLPCDIEFDDTNSDSVKDVLYDEDGVTFYNF